MKASFDDVRRQLIQSFNALAKTNLDPTQQKALEDMRMSVVGLICMYDEHTADDCNDMSHLHVAPLLEDPYFERCNYCGRINRRQYDAYNA